MTQILTKTNTTKMKMSKLFKYEKDIINGYVYVERLS